MSSYTRFLDKKLLTVLIKSNCHTDSECPKNRPKSINIYVTDQKALSGELQEMGYTYEEKSSLFKKPKTVSLKLSREKLPSKYINENKQYSFRNGEAVCVGPSQFIEIKRGDNIFGVESKRSIRMEINAFVCGDKCVTTEEKVTELKYGDRYVSTKEEFFWDYLVTRSMGRNPLDFLQSERRKVIENGVSYYIDNWDMFSSILVE